MKLKACLKVLLVSFILIFRAEAQISEKEIEVLFNSTMSECMQKENASEGDIQALFDGAWPETREGKCFIECFFEEIGVVSFLLFLKKKHIGSSIFPVF